MSKHPFRGREQVARLYAETERQGRRVGALLGAKVSGENAGATIVALAREAAPPQPRLLEVGCGRGGTLARLVAELEPQRTVALDSSAAMLAAARTRAGPAVETVHGDFHLLPFKEGEFDLAVAAFCLYHADQPETVCAELARCIGGEGVVVLATKSANSYHELDAFVAASGLDRAAVSRPSLYERFHSGNLEEVAQEAFATVLVRHETHRFVFATPEDAATYASTVPKYHNCRDTQRVAAAFAGNWPVGGLAMSSVVSFGVAWQ
ncbi:MAG TPA: methyltransferase domain-containing protein [Solirubrobacterales bacterium]|nr:methyltransferase domain-containing protein [Solirubrobacterales bacterium]